MKLRKKKNKNRIKDDVNFAENEISQSEVSQNVTSQVDESLDGLDVISEGECEDESVVTDLPENVNIDEPEFVGEGDSPSSGESIVLLEDKPRKGKKNRKKRKKKMSPLGRIFVTVLVGGVLLIIASTPYFNVMSYEVKGSSYYTAEEIVIMGDCKTGKNIFWGSNLKDIETRLEQDPYIEEAKTRRLLPDKVLIEVNERRQVAAVVYGDNYVVIDNNGLVLRNTKVEPQVTLIQGVTISKIEVGQPIEIEEKVKFRQIMEMIGVMEASDMYFSKIVATKTGVDAYVLDNLVCEGSPQNIMAAMQNQNLQKVVKGLFDLKIERGTIKISGGEYISFNPAVD